MLKTLLTLLTIIYVSGCGKSQKLPEDTIKTTFQNPLWDGADPWMIKHGNEYIELGTLSIHKKYFRMGLKPLNHQYSCNPAM